MGIFLLQIINLIFLAIQIAIIARVIVSWLRLDPYHPVVRVLHQITEPMLAPIRQIVPPVGMLDLSPLILLLLLYAIQRIFVIILL